MLYEVITQQLDALTAQLTELQGRRQALVGEASIAQLKAASQAQVRQAERNNFV